MNLKAVLEGLLFVAGDEGLSKEKLLKILGVSEEEFNEIVTQFIGDLKSEERGLTIEEYNDNYKLVTKKEHADYYKLLVDAENSDTLSTAALETLAIIAYNEPITRIEIDKLRGVDSSYVIRKLVAKGLIKESGRSDLPGHPLLYKTTDDFLDCFNLSSLKDLPDISKYIQEETEIDEDSDLFTSIYKEEN